MHGKIQYNNRKVVCVSFQALKPAMYNDRREGERRGNSLKSL